MSKKQTPGMVVGGSPRRFSLSRFSLRTKLIVGAVLFVVVAVGAIAWAYGIFDKPKPVASTSTANKNATQLAKNAYNSSQTEDYAKTQQAIAGNAATATNDTEKATTYMEQATVALNAKKYDDAADYAGKAEAADPTDATAGLLGDIAMAKGDKTTAVKEYQLAITRVDKTSHTSHQRLLTFQTKLQAAQQ